MGVSAIFFGYCYWRIIKEFKYTSLSIPKSELAVYKDIDKELKKFLQKNPQASDSLLKYFKEINQTNSTNSDMSKDTPENKRSVRDLNENDKKDN